jgi:hypothetical protein
MAKKIPKKLRRRKVGRPKEPILTPALVEAMRRYILDVSPTTTKLAQVFGIARSTFYLWLEKEPGLKEAIDVTRDQERMLLREDAELSLGKLVRGFKYSETTWEPTKDGKLAVTKKARKFFAPSERAVEFALKNLEPKQWRERQEIEHSGNVPVTIISYAEYQAQQDGSDVEPIDPAGTKEALEPDLD